MGRFWILDFGFSTLDLGLWTLDFGVWSLDLGLINGDGQADERVARAAARGELVERFGERVMRHPGEQDGIATLNQPREIEPGRRAEVVVLLRLVHLGDERGGQHRVGEID